MIIALIFWAKKVMLTFQITLNQNHIILGKSSGVENGISKNFEIEIKMLICFLIFEEKYEVFFEIIIEKF